MAIFKKYPTQTIKTFLEDAKENAVGGWDHFPRQLPFSQQRLGRVLARISGLESRLRKVALLIIFFAPFIGLVAVRVNPYPYERRLVSMLFAMMLTFLCFLTLSGTTFWTGPRLLYPAEILEISAAAMLVAVLVRAVSVLSDPFRISSPPPTEVESHEEVPVAV
jgi:hypothetical protein